MIDPLRPVAGDEAGQAPLLDPDLDVCFLSERLSMVVLFILFELSLLCSLSLLCLLLLLVLVLLLSLSLVVVVVVVVAVVCCVVSPNGSR